MRECKKNMLNGEYGLSAEKKIKIAVFSNEAEAVSRKVSKILKRKYTVFYASPDPGASGLMVDLFHSRSVEGFLAYYAVDLVLVCSSIFGDGEHRDEIRESIRKIICYCMQNGIKPVFLMEKYQVAAVGGKAYEVLGRNDWYSGSCEEITRSVLACKNGLVIKCPAIYGYDIKTGETDLLKFLTDREADCRGWDETVDNMHPLLADEVGEVLSSLISFHGEIDLCDKENRGRYFDFSDKEKGLGNIARQKGCAFNLIYQLMPDDSFGGQKVAKVRLALGERLAACIPDAIKNRIDYIVPVPKTGLYYAMGLSKGLQIPYMQGILKDSTEERSFQLLDVNVRKKFLKTRLSPIGEILENKSILVVDEAVFTGTTLKMACRMLREAGVKHIYLGIPTPPCYVPCSYYVQPKREMLLEYIRYDMLTEYFDVDDIYFQTVDAFMEEIPELEELCTECFTGR